MLGPIGKNLSVESFQDFLIEFDMKSDLIFKILYFLKMCPIFVGSVHNFGRSDGDIIYRKIAYFH